MPITAEAGNHLFAEADTSKWPRTAKKKALVHKQFTFYQFSRQL
jgi:hypothetical protein